MAIEVTVGVETNWVGAGFSETTTVEELFGYDDEDWKSLSPSMRQDLLSEYATDLLQQYASGFAYINE